MLAISDLKMKEVIDISNGERLGYIYDFEIDLEKGTLLAMVVPGPNKGLSLFAKPNDLVIKWEDVVIIGKDTILIDFQ